MSFSSEGKFWVVLGEDKYARWAVESSGCSSSDSESESELESSVNAKVDEENRLVLGGSFRVVFVGMRHWAVEY